MEALQYTEQDLQHAAQLATALSQHNQTLMESPEAQATYKEQALLGSILMAGHDGIFEAYHRVNLLPDDLFSLAHRRIYATMIELSNNGIEPNITALQEALKTTDKQGVVQASHVMGAAWHPDASTNGIYERARILKKLGNEYYAKNRLAELTMGIDSGKMSSKQISAALAQIHSELEERQGDIEADSAETVTEAALADVDTRIDARNEGYMLGLPTGIKFLDNDYWGMQAQELIIIAGLSATGKSALMIYIANQVLMAGRRVAIFSCEMDKRPIGKRFIALRHNVSLTALNQGFVTRDKMAAIEEAERRDGDGMFYWQDRLRIFPPKTSRTIETVVAHIRRLHREHGLDVVFVDYIQAYRSLKPANSKAEQLENVARALKDIADELGIVVVALSQLHRAGVSADFRPTKDNLKDSSEIGNAADVVWMMSRLTLGRKDLTPEEKILLEKLGDQQRLLCFDVDKNRNAHEKRYYVIFNPIVQTFTATVEVDFDKPF